METSPSALAVFDWPARAVYSPREVEAITGASHASIYRWIGAGRLDARKLGGKTVITRESLEHFLADLPPAKVRAA